MARRLINTECLDVVRIPLSAIEDYPTVFFTLFVLKIKLSGGKYPWFCVAKAWVVASRAVAIIATHTVRVFSVPTYF